MKIIWTELALDDYDKCIIYLEKYFSDKVVHDFLFMVDESCLLITKNLLHFH
jgi:hypothetical protein